MGVVRRNARSKRAGQAGARALVPTLALVPSVAVALLALSSTQIGYQDLMSYLARQSGADQTWRRQMAQQVHPSLRMASFALARPIARDEQSSPIMLARLEAGTATGGEMRRNQRLIGPPLVGQGDRGVAYPRVDRSVKGDLLAERPKIRLGSAEGTGELRISAHVLFDPAAFASGYARLSPRSAGEITGTVAALRPGAMTDAVGAMPVAGMPQIAGLTAEMLDAAFEEHRQFAETLDEDRAGIAITREGPIARSGAGLGVRPMAAETPAPRIATTHEPVAGFDPILSAFAADRRGDRPDPVLARLFIAPPPLTLELKPAEQRTVAIQPGHPALTLRLEGAALSRAERCMAEAVYWEARGEPEAGQIGVAQVVLNRAVSGFYPRDICGVVYQNAHRYLACQFTFACEGRRNLTPTEREPWVLAQRIARDMMAGRAWLPQVGHATHYHANYVSPWWARSMNKLKTIGVHLFYRPRAWGSGEG